MRLRFPLFRATYEWLIDEELTPYFLVNAEYPGVIVPKEYVEDGEIVLDASAEAIDEMVFDEEGISFSAGFDDGEFRIFFPIGAIIALYAEENEQGVFTTDEVSTLLVQESEEPILPGPQSKKSESSKKEKSRGQLKLVK